MIHKLIHLFFSLLFVATNASAFTEEEIRHEEKLTEIAKSRCDTEFIEGKDFSIKVNANGNFEVSLFGKKGGGLDGTFVYTKEEWEGRQRVLKEHQSSENTSRRKCIREELDSLRERYQPKQKVGEELSIEGDYGWGRFSFNGKESFKSTFLMSVFNSGPVAIDRVVGKVKTKYHKEGKYIKGATLFISQDKMRKNVISPKLMSQHFLLHVTILTLEKWSRL